MQNAVRARPLRPAKQSPRNANSKEYPAFMRSSDLQPAPNSFFFDQQKNRQLAYLPSRDFITAKDVFEQAYQVASAEQFNLRKGQFSSFRDRTYRLAEITPLHGRERTFERLLSTKNAIKLRKSVEVSIISGKSSQFREHSKNYAARGTGRLTSPLSSTRPRLTRLFTGLSKREAPGRGRHTHRHRHRRTPSWRVTSWGTPAWACRDSATRNDIQNEASFQMVSAHTLTHCSSLVKNNRQYSAENSRGWAFESVCVKASFWSCGQQDQSSFSRLLWLPLKGVMMKLGVQSITPAPRSLTSTCTRSLSSVRKVSSNLPSLKTTRQSCFASLSSMSALMSARAMYQKGSPACLNRVEDDLSGVQLWTERRLVKARAGVRVAMCSRKQLEGL